MILNYFNIKALIFLLSIIIINESVFSACIDKKYKIDYECKCTLKNNCFNSPDQSLKNELQELKTSLGEKNAKKLIQKQYTGLKDANKLFSNKNFSFKDTISDIKKLDRINKALAKKVNKKLLEMNSKIKNLEDSQKLINKVYKKSIKKEILIAIQNKGINLANNYRQEPINEQNKNFLQKSDDMNSTEKITQNNSDLDKSSNRLNVKDYEKQAESFKKNRKFKNDLIHPKHAEIWTIISARYSVKSITLDQSALKKTLHKKDKKKSLQDIYQLIDLL